MAVGKTGRAGERTLGNPVATCYQIACLVVADYAIALEIIEGNFCAPTGNGKILTVDRNAAENFIGGHFRLLVSRFGTDLKG